MLSWNKLHLCFKFAFLNYGMENLPLYFAEEYTSNVMEMNLILMKALDTTYDSPG